MRWLDALHVLDSAFPTGAYVHSFGLESIPSQGRLSVAELQAMLELRLEETLARFELVFVHHAYHSDLVDLDERCHAMLLARESREANSAIGRNLLRAASDLLEDSRVGAFARAARHAHHPVVFGAVAAALELEPEEASKAYAFNAIRGQVSAAQRLGWLGQRDAQRVLHALKPRTQLAAKVACSLVIGEAGGFAPLWDIASMAHERATVRMFAS